MFRFIVRHLHWLARVPLVPQLFDAMLLIWTALFHRQRLAAMEALEAAALNLPGVAPRVHRFGGIGFRKHDREFAHLHGNGLLDVHLTRERAAELIAVQRALPHHVFGPSKWISFWLRSPDDLENALALIEEGAAAA
jgi:hypothetical protein